MQEYSTAAYAKSNIAVVANGAAFQDLQKWVDQFFNDSPATPPKDLPEAGTSKSKYYGGEERVSHDSGNTMILGFPGSSSFTGGSFNPVIPVLTALLGGKSTIKWSPGFSLLSKATQAFPQAHIDTTHHTYSDAGLLTVSLTGSARQIRDASLEVVKTIKDVAAGKISNDDIKRARATAKFSALESGQNIDTGIELTGAGLIQGGKPHHIDEVGKSIEGVNEWQVKAVSLTNLGPTIQPNTNISRLQNQSWTPKRPFRLLEIFMCCHLQRRLASACESRSTTLALC